MYSHEYQRLFRIKYYKYLLLWLSNLDRDKCDVTSSYITQKLFRVDVIEREAEM